MKYIVTFFYRVWQVCVMLPVWACITIFTAITTIIFQHWRNSNWLHRIQQFWSRSFYWLLFLPVRVTGCENIDAHQSYVFIANHQSMADVFLIYGWLPSVFKWLMKAELRKIPFVGTACKAAGHIYVKRGNSAAAAESLKACEKVLHDGVCTVIFPEGTRTETGEVGRFKRGALQIALDLKLPIVPISLSGCYEVMNRHQVFARWHPVHMHIGKPIDISQLSEDNTAAAIAEMRQAVINNIDDYKFAK